MLPKRPPQVNTFKINTHRRRPPDWVVFYFKYLHMKYQQGSNLHVYKYFFSACRSLNNNIEYHIFLKASLSFQVSKPPLLVREGEIRSNEASKNKSNSLAYNNIWKENLIWLCQAFSSRKKGLLTYMWLIMPNRTTRFVAINNDN